MKYFALLLLSALPAFGQLTMQQMQPFFNGARASSAFSPTNLSTAMWYWYDTIPTPSFNSSRDTLNGVGSIPSDNANCLSVVNFVNGGSYANSNVGIPKYFVSGGGNSGTTPRWSMNVANARFIAGGGPPSSGAVFLTNYTVIMVVKIAAASTANQGLCNNVNSTPYLELNASKLTMNAGTPISGAATIANIPYIITWMQKSATSEIYTNGVLYVTGNDGTDGFGSGTPYISQARVNHFTGDISRFWLWTNTLSSTEHAAAVAQCKTDFGFP